MGLDCGLTTIKYILGFFNFLIFVCGGALLGVGIWLVVDKKSVHTILKASDNFADGNEHIQHVNAAAVLEQAGWILIAAGSIVFLLGFLGCCGACQESQCMLATYAVILGIILCAEVGAGIYAGVAKDKFTKDLKWVFKSSLKGYRKEEDALTLAWNYVFAEFECCGVNNYSDFKDTKWYDEATLFKFPVACCKLSDKEKFKPIVAGCQASPDYLTTNANKGCYDALLDWINNHLAIVIGVGVGLGLIQLFAVVFACCLCCALNKK